MEGNSESSGSSDVIKIKVPTFGSGKFLKSCRENPWMVSTLVLVVLALLIIFGGNIMPSENPNIPGTGAVVLEGTTFQMTGDDVCTDSQGRPYVILFSTTWCPHCVWIKDTFDSLANEDFASEINLQHWELDIEDNTLTSQIETSVPSEIGSMFTKYSNGGVPAFVFGCSYVRIGNGYESKNDLNAELEEFRYIIEEGLLS